MSATRPKNADLGVILTLLDRFNAYRLPFALQLKEKVDRGESLSAYDLRFMKKVISEGNQARRLAMKYPKYQSVVDEATALYAEILRRSTENEAKGVADSQGRF